MEVKIDDMVRDYLALRGESPDLLPLLEEGEESAVLTLRRKLLASLPAAAAKATVETPRLFLDEVREADVSPEVPQRGVPRYRMPDDYLMFYSLRMADWSEPVEAVEPEGSLRRGLGARAPLWMVCRERPMVLEERDGDGIVLKVYGSDAFDLPASILYVPRPAVEGDTLRISRGAYWRLLLQETISN